MARIDVNILYVLCKVCWGTGVTEETTGTPPNAQVTIIECPNCGGKKLAFGGYITTDTVQILDPEIEIPDGN